VIPHSVMTRHERGAALVLTLVVVALVAGLGGSLLLVVSMETAVQTHHQQVLAVRQATESGVACVLSDLRQADDWAPALAGEAQPGVCLAPMTLPAPPHGPDPDVLTLTAALQAATDARYGPGADTPRWTPWIVGLAPAGAATGSPTVVIAWVADDADDGDGDPYADANAVIWVRVEAWGAAGARAAVEVIVRRGGPDGIPPAAVAAWRTVR
jgi:hypothetical protein